MNQKLEDKIRKDAQVSLEALRGEVEFWGGVENFAPEAPTVVAIKELEEILVELDISNKNVVKQ